MDPRLVTESLSCGGDADVGAGLGSGEPLRSAMRAQRESAGEHSYRYGIGVGSRRGDGVHDELSSGSKRKGKNQGRHLERK